MAKLAIWVVEGRAKLTFQYYILFIPKLQVLSFYCDRFGIKKSL